MSKVKRKVTKVLNRKDLRKQKKEEKKGRKRLFFSSKKHGMELVAAELNRKTKKDHMNKPKKRKRTNDDMGNMSDDVLLSSKIDSNEDEIVSDAENNEDEPILSVKKKKSNPHRKQKSLLIPHVDMAEARKREKLKEEDLKNQARKQRIKQLVKENEEEDKLISKLEKKLKLNKIKDKNKLVRKMFSDGLDYALEFCLDDDSENKKINSKAAFKEDKDNEGIWTSKNSEESDEDSIEDILNSDEEFSDNSNDTPRNRKVEQNTEDKTDKKMPSETNKKAKQDIYGRNLDGSESGGPLKYLPPQQRAILELKNEDKHLESMEYLKKNCKGLLNRLSEANLHKIAVGIEELYMKNSRFNMNETLSILLKEALIKKTIVNERMIQEHIVLLAYLHAQIGNEIGAHFLQVFIEEFNSYLNEIEKIPVEDKSLNNVVLVLSYFYLFKIYEHRLLIGIIERFTENLCEKTIECLLLIFRSVGVKLRKDNPVDFKQMMVDMQQKIAQAPLELKENLRLKFMVETLNAVKNNNITKISDFDPELGENLRKRLKAMLHNGKYVVSLNITLKDLLRADTVGKWWVVGSAWSGNVQDLGSSQNHNSSTTTKGYSENLLKLAKKYKMNTEERRNIFCVIMMANDFIDAFQNILHLNLKDQRNIAYVVLHCALLEKQSNPYYSHLALKLCNFSRKFQLAFQFAIWDRVNEIDSLKKEQIQNLAKFTQHLILQKGLQLSVLKVVDFLQLNKLSFLFMKEVMKGIFLNPDEKEIYDAFERIAKNDKLKQFKQSIQLFMSHFLLKEGASKIKLSNDQLDLLKKRVDHACKLLAYNDL